MMEEQEFFNKLSDFGVKVNPEPSFFGDHTIAYKFEIGNEIFMISAYLKSVAGGREEPALEIFKPPPILVKALAQSPSKGTSE